MTAATKAPKSFRKKFPFCVGPMVGLTHVAFRELIRGFTPPSVEPLLFSEMLSTLRLPSERFHIAEELLISEQDRGRLVIQILGNQESFIQRSIERLHELDPWGIDINMGCPVKRTLRHNWGVKLMGDPIFAGEVAGIARKHWSGPLSVKLRCGLEKTDRDFIFDFTSRLEDAGVDWISIHARLKSQKHKGVANWDLLGEIKQKRSIPIIGNGDIQTADDAISLIEDFGLDGAMVGRAATAKPWIFWQIAYKMGIPCDPPRFCPEATKPPETLEEEGIFYLKATSKFIELLDQYFINEGKKLRKFRFFVTQSHKWCVFGHSFYSHCMKIQEWADAKEAVELFRNKASNFPMRSRISLL